MTALAIPPASHPLVDEEGKITAPWYRLFQQAFARLTDLELIDGVTAPSAVVGLALVYVDEADGDLKVIFGDGTIKTIVVDT